MLYPYGPTYFVKAVPKDGPELDLTSLIDGFSYEDDEEKEDKLSFSLKVGLGDKLIDHAALVEGTPLKFRFGYSQGPYSPLRTALIVSAEPDFGENGVSIKIEATDKSSEMKTSEQTKTWSGKTLKQIAEEVAKNHKLKTSLEDVGGVLPDASQSNQSDWGFLQKLAGDNNAKVYVEGDTLFLKKVQFSDAPARTFTYMAGQVGPGALLSFKPKSKKQEKGKAGAKTTAVGTDPDKLGQQKHTTTADNAPVQKLGPGTTFIDPVTGKVTTKRESQGKAVVTPATKPADLKAKADSVQTKSASGEHEASLSCVGDPNLKAKVIISVAGVGKRHSGKWHVKSVKHSFGATYSCELNLKRAGSGVGTKTPQPVNTKPSKDGDGKTPATKAMTTIDARTGEVRRG